MQWQGLNKYHFLSFGMRQFRKVGKKGRHLERKYGRYISNMKIGCRESQNSC